MNWIVPSLEGEMGEFERAAREYGLQVHELILLFRNGALMDLDDETWSKLENTDSWNTVSFRIVMEIAAKHERNARPIFDALLAHTPIQAPIVLGLADGRTVLVSGNTRLMVYRALGVRPQVFRI